MTAPGTRTRHAPRWTAPSLGFCLMVVIYSLTLAFFAWGLTTPRLDRIWQLHHELKTGDVYTPRAEDARVTLELEPSAAWVAEAYPTETLTERPDGRGCRDRDSSGQDCSARGSRGWQR